MDIPLAAFTLPTKLVVIVGTLKLLAVTVLATTKLFPTFTFVPNYAAPVTVDVPTT